MFNLILRVRKELGGGNFEKNKVVYFKISYNCTQYVEMKSCVAS